jgi:transposase
MLIYRKDVALSHKISAHRRHDITDKTWTTMEPHLPGRKGSWGGIAKDNRNFINAVF